MTEGTLNLDALLSAKDAALYTGKSINAIVNWRNRGYLPVATDAKGQEIRDKQGRPRYRLLDVAKAENATRQRGQQMAAGHPPSGRLTPTEKVSCIVLAVFVVVPLILYWTGRRHRMTITAAQAAARRHPPGLRGAGMAARPEAFNWATFTGPSAITGPGRTPTGRSES